MKNARWLEDRNPGFRPPMRVVGPDGRVYRSQRKAAKENGLHLSTLQYWIRNNHKGWRVA